MCHFFCWRGIRFMLKLRSAFEPGVRACGFLFCAKAQRQRPGDATAILSIHAGKRFTLRICIPNAGRFAASTRCDGAQSPLGHTRSCSVQANRSTLHTFHAASEVLQPEYWRCVESRSRLCFSHHCVSKRSCGPVNCFDARVRPTFPLSISGPFRVHCSASANGINNLSHRRPQAGIRQRTLRSVAIAFQPCINARQAATNIRQARRSTRALSIVTTPTG